MRGHFSLPKGTIVKHGTDFGRLDSIFTEGLQSGTGRQGLRNDYERAPETAGVYVGNFMAYHSAYAAYSAIIVPDLVNWDGYAEAQQIYAENPSALKNHELPSTSETWPAVLTIELQEDVEVWADEDFIQDGTVPLASEITNDTRISEAQNVWEKWQSGCLKRSIPASWITHYEIPRLTNLYKKIEIHKQFIMDIELLVAGVAQGTHHRRPGLIERDFKKYGLKLNLSQKERFTGFNIGNIPGKAIFDDSTNRLFNHLHMTNFFKTIADQRGVSIQNM